MATLNAEATARDAPPSRAGAALRWGLAAVAGAALAAPVLAAAPLPLLLLAPVVIALVAVAYRHPPAAAYVVIAATPLTAGLARSGFIPLLRPHEAIGVAVGAGVGLRALAQLGAGYRLPLRLGRLDAAILSMAVASSLLPLLWLAARGDAPTMDDLLYAAAIWKFYGLFVLVRSCVRTPDEVRWCLRLALLSGGVVAVLAIGQSLELADLPRLLDTIYPTEAPTQATAGRGSSTLGSSHAVGDVMAICLAVCLGWLLRRPGGARTPRRTGAAPGAWPRWGLALGAGLFTLGGLASGQFSGAIALAVAVAAVAVGTGQVRRLLVVLGPMAVAGVVALWPVIQIRLAGFGSTSGLPQSWEVRLANLREFVWPQLFTGYNWLLGVRPAARIQADVPWGPYVYLESGHAWLLWTGGVPLVVAFLFFTVVAVAHTATVARRAPGPAGVAGVGALAGVLVVFVLMAFDPHLTMRGTADLVFSLLALAVAVPGAVQAGDRDHAPTPGHRERTPA